MINSKMKYCEELLLEVNLRPEKLVKNCQTVSSSPTQPRVLDPKSNLELVISGPGVYNGSGERRLVYF